jgi:lysophospholipase L1-like esterase
MTPAIRALLFGRRLNALQQLQRVVRMSGGGAIFNISDISTMSQDAAGTTPAVVGQKVMRLLDVSGFGWNVAQTSAANAPILRQDALGNYYLEGDGTAKFMVAAAGSAAAFKFLHSGTGATMGCAVALTETPADNSTVRVIGTGYTATLAGAGIYMATTSPAATNAYVITRGGNGTQAVFSGASAIGDIRTDGGAHHFLTTYKTQSGADMRLYVDGSQPNSAGVAESNTPTSNNADDVLQLFSASAGTYFNGKFYGAVFLAAEVTATERRQINRWLQSLYDDTSYLLGVGDSHTYNVSYGQNKRNFYPALLDTLLRPGQLLAPLNYGSSGNSTANIIARLTTVVEAGAGEIAVIYAGTNDLNAATTVQAAPAPSSTVFTVGAGKGVYFGVGGQITVNGEAAIVASVATDAITLTSALSFTPTAGQTVAISTQANIISIGSALLAAGYRRLIVCGQHYLNFASGGDTVATPLASNATLRVEQSAAATALGALYVDFHAYMRALIVATTYAQGDDTAWHVAIGNTHLNNTGEQILADAIYAAMQAQGWA